jgi:hypothetical protein
MLVRTAFSFLIVWLIVVLAYGLAQARRSS